MHQEAQRAAPPELNRYPAAGFVLLACCGGDKVLVFCVYISMNGSLAASTSCAGGFGCCLCSVAEKLLLCWLVPGLVGDVLGQKLMPSLSVSDLCRLAEAFSASACHSSVLSSCLSFSCPSVFSSFCLVLSESGLGIESWNLKQESFLILFTPFRE